MKQNNIIKSFSSGWILGLSDGNRVLVETPSGESFEPYEGPGHQIFGTVEGDETVKVNDPEVCADIRKLWHKKHEAHEKALAAGDVDPVDGDLSEAENDGEQEEVPTLHDLGFDDSVKLAEI
jgi:hypothetical protein